MTDVTVGARPGRADDLREPTRPYRGPKQEMVSLRERGMHRIDVAVLPRHRLAKNLFETSGFKARSIIMHHEDL